MSGPKTVSSKPVWQRVDQNELPPIEDVDDEAEAGCSILGMFYTYVPQDEAPSRDRSATVPAFLTRESTVVKYVVMIFHIYRNHLIGNHLSDFYTPV